MVPWVENWLAAPAYGAAAMSWAGLSRQGILLFVKQLQSALAGGLGDHRAANHA